MQVILNAKTNFAKQRIESHGARWNILGRGNFNGKSAVHIMSVSDTFHVTKGVRIHDTRWVQLHGEDKHFTVDFI